MYPNDEWGRGGGRWLRVLNIKTPCTEIITFLSFSFPFQVPDLVAFFPLNAAYGTKEIKNRVAEGDPERVSQAPGPDGTANSAYEFAGTADSYIEFPNTEGGSLDVRYSMTMLCWVYYNGKNGPLFNYKTSGYHWGVHLWVVDGQLFVRFNHRN